MHKHRHIERRETLAYWPAVDTVSGDSVGLITNLSEEGVQIHSKHDFSVGQLLTIRIAVDPELTGCDFISIAIENVWCRASGVPGLFHAGFKIVDISDKAKRGLKNLFESFSYALPGSDEDELN